MNEQFYELPQEKRLRIINAGLEVFAHNDYKRASTELIAQKAGISKGLLFYYFHNKKSLYLFLYSYAEELAKKSVLDEHFFEITDFFELFEYSAQKKYLLMEQCPHISDFMVRCFYSKDEPVSEEMDKKVNEASAEMYAKYFTKLDYSKFKPDSDPQEIMKMLTWMADGYMHDRQRANLPVDMNDMMKEFKLWTAMFLKVSYKEEYQR